MVFRYLPLLCYFLAFLLGDVRSSSSGSVARTNYYKRASSHHPNQSSSKLSVKDLALELAKAHLLKMILSEHADLDKAKESVYILQRDRCTNIKSVSKPVTHNARHCKFGNWMKDPLGIMGAETIIVMENDINDKKEFKIKNVVEEFENMDKFKAGMPRKTYKLPYQWDGTGAVVYGPYLYYNRENSIFIIKYNLHTERVEASIEVSGYTAWKTGYEFCSGGRCGMDLAVDEQGLWVLWGSTENSGKLHASKIDVNRNVITYTWTLDTEPMNAMGNAFVACGVIYCIDTHNTNPTTINFAYDTKTGKQWNPNIQFTNQYGKNYMVDYNPREKVLYAWDNRRQVTYPIIFEKEVSRK